MAKKPQNPDPADLPEPDDLFPADAFELPDPDAVAGPESGLALDVSDAEVIADADLFDFTEADQPSGGAPIPVAVAPTAAEPAEEDIFAWDEPADGASAVGGSSILSPGEPLTAAESGWLDSAVGLSAGSGSPLPASPTSRVDLQDPLGHAARGPESGSSIFGRKAVDESSLVNLDLPRPAAADRTDADSGVFADALDAEVTDAVPVDASSIWDESDSMAESRRAAQREDDSEGLDWEVPAAADNEPQHTLRASRPDLDADDDLRGWLEEEVREPVLPTPAPSRSPISDGTGVGVTLSAPAPKRPPSEPDMALVPDLEDEYDDEPARAEPKRPAPKPEAKKGGAAGWIGGGLAGLLVGAGGVFGLSQAGILGGDTKPTAQQPGTVNPGPANPNPANPPAVPTAEQGIAALDRGDAATAKKALEALPADQLTAATQATRGHARLLARVQELADSGAAVKAGDKELLDAETDLKAVFDKAADLKTPDEQQAAVRAALNLGLLKELAGDTAGATKVYTAAAAAVPAGKREFETALKRLKLTAPAAPGKTSAITPRQGEQLLLAVAFLLQGDPAPAKGEKGDGEPGHLFWDAANSAAAGDFAAAAKRIAEAKAAHEARRLKLVGRGTNPKSDPAEQIFLSTCDQLTELYTLKATLYGHPVAGPLAKSDGAAKALDKLADAQEKFTKADADRLKSVQELVKAQAQLDAVITERKTAETMLKSATDDLKKAMTDLTAAEKVKEAREQALAGVVKELKAAKLVPDDADLTATLAKIPDIAKQAAGGGDAKKLTDLLATAKKDYDASQANLKAATDDLTKAKAEVSAAMKLADDRSKELTDFQKKAKANDDVLAGLVKEFKSAKLIPEDADAAAAMAKLPDAAKKAASAAASSDATKAAEALLAAKKELDTVQTALKKAETDLTAARKDAADAMALAKKESDDKAAALKMVDAVKADAAKALKDAKDDAAKAIKAATDNADKAAKAVADADKALKAAQDAEKLAKTGLDNATKALALAKKETDDKVKAAVEKAVADAADKLKVAEAAATKAVADAKKAADDRKAAEDKLAAATDKLASTEADFARQLAVARAGGTGTITPAEMLAQEKADAAYADGLRHYFAGRSADAEKEFRAAVLVPDARYHYFLGLALLAQGKDAAPSFRTGYEFERRNLPNAQEIGEALERVQGPARAELAKFRR